MNKTDQVNFNAAMKFANDSIAYTNEKNLRKEHSINALGLLMKICLKTSMRVSDILKLKYSQFKEDKLNPSHYILAYRVTKSSINNEVPIWFDLKNDIDQYRKKCNERYNFDSEMIFFNYQTQSMFTRVWASKNISKANVEGKLGQVVNVAGTHSIRKTAVNFVFNETNSIKLAKELLGHKNILTTSHYLEDEKKSIQDQLRAVLCK